MTHSKLHGLAAALGALWFANPLPAPTCGSGCLPRIGLIGVAPGDTLRLHAVLTPPDPIMPAGACTLQAAITQPAGWPAWTARRAPWPALRPSP